MKRLLLLPAGIFLLLLSSNAQIAVTTDGSSPDPSAMLDVKGANKGVLIPRVALAGTNDNTIVPSAVDALLVYNTATTGGANAVLPGFYYWRSGSWTRLTSSEVNVFSAWVLGGNTGTTNSNYIGTNDNTDLRFRVNNEHAGLVGTNGNVFWGRGAGSSNTSGQSNIAIGRSSLYNNSTGGSQIAIGDSSMFAATTGGSNVAIGHLSMRNVTTAFANVAIGNSAMYLHTTGQDNTAVGAGALRSSTGAWMNTAIGSSALRLTTATMNTGVGAWTLYNNTTGAGNVAAGVQSLYNNSSGSENAGVGMFALFNNTLGQYNAAFGSSALFSNTYASGNVAMGYQSSYSNTRGYSNVAIGVRAMFANSTGTNMVAIGDSALYNGTAASFNVAVGSKAMFSNTTGFANTAIGSSAMFAHTTGQDNTAIGANTLRSSTTAWMNTAVGSAALRMTTATSNTAVGAFALQNNTIGAANVAIGAQSMLSNTTGSSNIAIGEFSGGNQVTGNYTSAFGSNTRFGANNLTNATAMGARSQVDCSNCLVLGSVNGVNGGTSDVNVGIGTTNPFFPLNFNNQHGDKISLWGNTLFHYGFGVQAGTLQVIVGDAGGSVTFGHGSSAAFTEKVRITGNGFVGIGEPSPAYPLNFTSSLGDKISLWGNGAAHYGFGIRGNELLVHTDQGFSDVVFGHGNATTFSETGRMKGNGNMIIAGTYSSSSDIRLKKNITAIPDALQRITALNGYNYYWNDPSKENSLQTGVIAQEVQKLFPELVSGDKHGMLSVNYQGLIPVLIESIKEQQTIIENQQQQHFRDMLELKKEIELLKNQIRERSAKR